MASKITINWHDGPVTKMVRDLAEQRLRKVGSETVQKMQRDLGGPSPSPPGQPPGRRTGRLQRSIAGRITKPSPNKVRLTINAARYSVPLEFAKTPRRRRPFVGRALAFATTSIRRWFGIR